MMKRDLLALILGSIMSLNAHAGPLDTLSFLEGCWGTINENGQKVTEDWFARKSEVMLGVSQTFAEDGSMTEYEFIEIKWYEPGQRVTYTPFYNGRQLNTFTLDRSEGSEEGVFRAVFSDPGNATLQRITYTLKSKNIRNVRLTGNSKSGAPFDISFDMKREDCNSRLGQ